MRWHAAHDGIGDEDPAESVWGEDKFPWRDYGSMIDIGCAQGAVPVAIAQVHEHLTGGGFDLPPVEPIFNSYVAKCGLSERLTFTAGNGKGSRIRKERAAKREQEAAAQAASGIFGMHVRGGPFDAAPHVALRKAIADEP